MFKQFLLIASFFKQLLVGSEDFAIRVFEFEEIIADMSETEVFYKRFNTRINYFCSVFYTMNLQPH